MATGTILLPIMGCVLDAASPPGYAFTNSRPKLLFNDTTDEIIYWTFRMPVDYASSPVLKVFYSMAGANTEDEIVFDCLVMAVSDGDAVDMDTDSYDASNAATKTVPDTAGRPDEVSVTLANADGVAAEDFVALKAFRDADNIADDAAGDMEVWAASLEYTTT